MPLSSSQDVGTWIHHFVHSDNPKFKGKSKEKRRKMALGAYYAAKRGKESLDFDSANSNNILQSSTRTIMKPAQRIIESAVSRVIFDEADSDASVTTGFYAYSVKLRYRTPENDVVQQQTVNARGANPEEAKARAIASAQEMGRLDVSVADITMVVDTGPGQMKPTSNNNTPSDITAGLVLPSAVSPSLPNSGVLVPTKGGNAVPATNAPSTSQNFRTSV
jgi:hypothetical protein